MKSSIVEQRSRSTVDKLHTCCHFPQPSRSVLRLVAIEIELLRAVHYGMNVSLVELYTSPGCWQYFLGQVEGSLGLDAAANRETCDFDAWFSAACHHYSGNTEERTVRFHLCQSFCGIEASIVLRAHVVLWSTIADAQ